MASPITWQNVNGRSLAEAAVPLESASKMILGGFDRLSNTADGYGKLQQTIQNQEEEANVQSFMERLQRARSPEEVAALQASGELDTLRAALKPTSLAKVRGAEDARIASLMQQTTAKNTFEDSLAKRAADPIFEQYRLAGLNGDEAAQAKLLADNPNLRGWATAVEQDKALERKMIEQARADRLAPIQEANAIAEGKIKGLQLSSAEQAAKDAAEQRRLSAQLAKEQQTYLSGKVAGEDALGAAAKRLGLPVDDSGRAKVDDYTPEQKAALNKEAVLAGGQPIDVVRGSDTAVADKMLARLMQSGEFSPETIMKNRDAIRGAFASNVSSGAIGNDAAAIALARAQEKVMMEEKAANNWSAPGAPDTRRNYEELAKDVPSLINKESGFGVEKDIGPIQGLLNDLAINGLEIKSNGKTVRVTPSVNDVRGAIREAKGNRFGWGDDVRADNIREILQKRYNSPEVIERLSEAGDIQAYRRKQAVRELLNK